MKWRPLLWEQQEIRTFHLMPSSGDNLVGAYLRMLMLLGFKFPDSYKTSHIDFSSASPSNPARLTRWHAAYSPPYRWANEAQDFIRHVYSPEIRGKSGNEAWYSDSKSTNVKGTYLKLVLYHNSSSRASDRHPEISCRYSRNRAFQKGSYCSKGKESKQFLHGRHTTLSVAGSTAPIHGAGLGQETPRFRCLSRIEIRFSSKTLFL